MGREVERGRENKRKKGKRGREEGEREGGRGGEDELTMEVPQPTFLCFVKPTVQL